MSLLLKHRHSHLLLGHWLQFQIRHYIPMEAALDSDVLRPILPYVGIVDLDDAGVARYRAVGVALMERYAQDLAGQSLDQVIWCPNNRSINGKFQQAASAAEPFFYISGALDSAGDWQTFETLWVPVRSRGGEAVTFIGVNQSLRGDNYKAPIKRREMMIALSFIDTGLPSQMMAWKNLGAESARPEPARKGAHLRLVKTC